ncbi:hypothetical protein Tco_0113586, partial [Tanacetum coccineum]
MPLVTRSTRSPLPLSATRLNPSPPSTAAAAANTTADTTPSSSSSCRHRRPYATTTATTTTTRPRGVFVLVRWSAAHKGAFGCLSHAQGCVRSVVSNQRGQRAALVLWLSTTRARRLSGQTHGVRGVAGQTR